MIQWNQALCYFNLARTAFWVWKDIGRNIRSFGESRMKTFDDIKSEINGIILNTLECENIRIDVWNRYIVFYNDYNYKLLKTSEWNSKNYADFTSNLYLPTIKTFLSIIITSYQQSKLLINNNNLISPTTWALSYDIR